VLCHGLVLLGVSLVRALSHGWPFPVIGVHCLCAPCHPTCCAQWQ
jgi:hypothetical protein